MKNFLLFMMILLIFTVSNAAALEMEDIQIHGFISQGYLKSSENNYLFAETEDGTFQFNEMGLNFITRLTDDLRVGLQFLSRDLGEIGNNEVKLDWAFADYRFRNWLGIQVGKMKTKYAFYNKSRDIDAARTWILLPMSVYDEVTRELYTSITGLGIYGEIPGGLFYNFQVGVMDMDKDGGLAKMTAKPGQEFVDIESDSDNLAIGLDWKTPLDGLKIGTSYRRDKNTPKRIFLENPSVISSQNVEVNIITGSLEYTYKDFVFSAEYRHRELDVTMGEKTLVKDQCEEGYYAAVQYRFTDWLEVGSYYSVVYADKDDRDGDSYKSRGLPRELAWRKDIALSTRFDINDNWIFKLEGHYMDGLYRADYDLDDPDPGDNWFLFAAKTTFSF